MPRDYPTFGFDDDLEDETEGGIDPRFSRHASAPTKDGRGASIAGLVLGVVMLGIPSLICSIVGIRHSSKVLRLYGSDHARTTRTIGFIGLIVAVLGIAIQLVVVALFATSIAERVAAYDSELATYAQTAQANQSDSSTSTLSVDSTGDTQTVGSSACGFISIPASWVQIEGTENTGMLCYCDPQTGSDDTTLAPYGYTSTVTISKWELSAASMATRFSNELAGEDGIGDVRVSSISSSGVTWTAVTAVNATTGIAHACYLTDSASGCTCIEFHALETEMCDDTSVLKTYSSG